MSHKNFADFVNYNFRLQSIYLINENENNEMSVSEISKKKRKIANEWIISFFKTKSFRAIINSLIHKIDF